MAIELTFPSPHANHDPKSRQCLIYFITGNPGLIDYYGPFFTHLRALLNAIEVRRNHTVTFHIYGRNLAGFDDADHPEPFDAGAGNPPHDVESQIVHCLKHLAAANSIPAPGHPRRGQPFDEVILTAHSLGTYITLELFHRHLQQDPQVAPGLNLKSGILLFATISHMARSPKGLHLDVLARSAYLRRYAPLLARAVLSLIPTPVLGLVARHVLGMAPHAAEATARFLASRDGVYQALYLGMDEMGVIGEDSWAEELWEIGDEAAARAHEVPKFFILFGKGDHWVADEHRDEFIVRREEHAARGEAPRHKRGRTRIVVDEGDHSETVAEKVSIWIDEIAEHP
ncbi:hypothetical protein VPNG_09591 [Cytospora leucostoma]|uniref:AB hydrolase-1 domain-containing protein n=1 Tax=Cytospora leucostoma TaxID=1230097 RepID=A0A423VN37_9PEZI|nr:hypothetical protein VPNG_09591 [Cytospora leucostoma]